MSNFRIRRIRLRPVLSAPIVAVCVIAAIPSGASGNDWERDLTNIQLSDADLRPASPATEVAQAGQGNGDGTQPRDGQTGGNGDAPPAGTGGDSVKELSQKTTDPTGELALIFTQFALTVNDGDDNKGDAKVAGNIVFQPIIPIPLYGSGNDEWRFVSRPTIEFRARQPVPQRGMNQFNRKTGWSDLNLPLPLSPPRSVTGKWLLALGPDFSFPTASHKAFGRQQWAAGVTGILGYASENWITGVYPQFYWGFADQGRDDDVKQARFGNMFYWFWYNLSDSMQVGLSPTMTYDDNASSGNKWNVPVGLGLSKMVKIGDTMTRIEVSAEYSVVHEKDFGQQARLKINIIPIVPRPIKSSIFGG